MADVTFSADCETVDWLRLKQDLVADDFDNKRTPEELRRSFEASHVVAFAMDGDRVVGKARALSDGVCNAYIVDVWTHSDFRRRGIARLMVEMLFKCLNGQHVALFDRGARQLYLGLGFTPDDTGYERTVGKWLGRYDQSET